MIALRRRTREALRHERAVVLQELGAPTAAQLRADIEANKTRAAELRRTAKGGESRVRQHLGLVTDETLAGGKGLPGSPGYVHTSGGWVWS